jgi:hypothetical protein
MPRRSVGTGDTLRNTGTDGSTGISYRVIPGPAVASHVSGPADEILQKTSAERRVLL